MGLKNSIHKTRILIYIDGFIPTSKAYGVTVRETASVLTELNFEVNLLAIESNYFDSDFEEILNLISYHRESIFSKSLRKFAQRGYSVFHVVSWQISRHLRLLSNKRDIVSFHPQIVWTRDRFLPRGITGRLGGSISIVEFHELISKQAIKQARNLGPSRVILAPISPTIRKSLESVLPDFTVIDAPMGIRFNASEFESNLKRSLSEKKEINVGYFGKISPQGYSKGIEDFLDLITRVKEEPKETNFKFQISGFLKSEEAALMKLIENRGIEEKDISLRTHAPHGESMRNMKLCDIFFLPSPSNDKYVGFPLKALEYFYSGGRIIVANSSIHRDIFGANQQPFWYTQGDSNSAYLSLLQCATKKFSQKEIREMSLFLEQFSWRKRTESILNRAAELLEKSYF